MEDTVVLTLRGKKYLATQLTRAEFRTIARLDAELRAASRDDDLPKTVTLVDGLAEIIRASILRSGSDVTAEEADLWPPNDVMKASGILVNFIGEGADRKLPEFPIDEKIQ
jgi:hypothetical protein